MKKSAVIMVLVLTAAALLAGCGSSGSSGSGVEGVYKLTAGDTTAAVVTLKDDGEATFSLTEDGGIPTTYKVKDDTVIIYAVTGEEALRLKIEDEGLRDDGGNLYEKQ